MKYQRPDFSEWNKPKKQWYQRPLYISLLVPLIILISVIIYFGLPKAIGMDKKNTQAGGCSVVTFAETGWTDITATTAVTKQILQSLDYQTKSYLLSVPVAFNAMSTGEIDAFLGFWQPSMNADIKPFLERDDVAILKVNLKGALYGLAVPKYLYDQGLHSFADVAKFRQQLNNKIYGVEPGNDANRILLSHIENNSYGLKGFQVVESSEQAMLSEVDAAIREKRPIVFLAWQPHPMNDKFRIAYLDDVGNWFGSGENGASVATIIRRGYQEQCPNVSHLLKNINFNMAMENALMDDILNKGQPADEAARNWLKKNPKIWQNWLDGVKSSTGEEGLSAVKAAILQ